MSRFVFLDRDGTLVRDTGYPHRLADYALLPGVASGLAQLRDAGFRFAVVTNQSGIGRGRFGPSDYARFQGRLVADLAARGIRIEASYHCPHPPEAGCLCRKPAPALLERARDELGAELARSWVVGDRESDVELAARAGCRGAVWLRADDGEAAFHETLELRTAPDLPVAAARILEADALLS